MKSKLVTTVVLLILSEALGIGVGEWFFRLFVKVVPPAAQSQFNSNASHIVFIGYGAAVGLLLLVWFMIGMAVGGMGKSAPKVVVAKA